MEQEVSWDGLNGGAHIRRTRSNSDAVRILERESRRYRALRDAVAEMIFTLNADGRFTAFTPGSGMDPFAPPEQFIGRPVTDVLPPDVAQSSMDAIRTALQTQHLQVITYELWEDGEARPYEARIAPAGDDEVVAVVRQKAASQSPVNEGECESEDEVLRARAERALLGPNPYSLTLREFMVLALMTEGLADKEIAARLRCSVFTVHQHVKNILAKMAARSRTESAVRALRQQLIPPM
jgi:DNA-binding NarL/FixJ family response regulator